MPHHAASQTAAPETNGRTMPGWSRLYDIVVKLFFLGREAAFRRTILDRAEVAPGESILDVGCGTGTLALAAKERVGTGGVVRGIDATPGMVETAHRKARKAGADVDFQVGLIEELPFPDGAFDLVLSSLMFHHLPEELQGRGLEEIGRVLKPGGRVVVVDFAAGSHSPLMHIFPFLSHGRHGDSAGRLVDQLRLASFDEIETLATPYKQFAFVRATKGERDRLG